MHIRIPPTKHYAVKVTRDSAGAGWLAEVKDLDQVRTSARTLESLNERVREAIKANDGTEFTIGYMWPNDIFRQIHPLDQARAKASMAREAALQSAIAAARELKKLGLSLRDTAHLLGMSHQRVQQLLGWKDE